MNKLSVRIRQVRTADGRIAEYGVYVSGHYKGVWISERPEGKVAVIRNRDCAGDWVVKGWSQDVERFDSTVHYGKPGMRECSAWAKENIVSLIERRYRVEDGRLIENKEEAEKMVNGFEKASLEEIDGTCLIGIIEASYEEIKAAFGEPAIKKLTGDRAFYLLAGEGAREMIDGGCVGGVDVKTSTEWWLKDTNGNVYTIYDWKMTYLYDRTCPSPEEIREKDRVVWNIGGKGLSSAEVIVDAVRGMHGPTLVETDKGLF